MPAGRMHDIIVGAVNAFPWSHYNLDPLTDGQPNTWPDDLADAILDLIVSDGEIEPDEQQDMDGS